MKQKDNESKNRIKQLKQEQKDIKKKKKEMKREMQDLKGENKGGKLSAILLFLGLIGAFLLFLIAMIKTDVGGIGTNVLAPIIKDVPGLNLILPSEVIPEAAKETKKNKEEETKKESDKDKASPTPSKTPEPSASPKEEPIESENPSASPDVTEQQLKDYADTYSKMEPEKAAAVMETMTGDLHLVAKILKTMKAADRAEIMDNMDVYIAAKLTVIMSRDLD